ncbi:MAG: hypothetical protein IPK91_04970 [Saprospiraceae bacterium]|nr:hypothetical protein [Saprospiraceae bacterium]
MKESTCCDDGALYKGMFLFVVVISYFSTSLSPTKKKSIMRIFIPVSLFWCLLLFHTSLSAQNYERLNGPYGGGSKVYEGKNGILFQRLFEDDDLAVLFRSVDGGATWKKMPTPAARQVYDPFTVAYNGNLYGAAGKNLYVSVNDGQSWSGLNSPTAEAIVNVNALPNGVLLVSDYEKVYRSINNGQSWIAVLQTDVDAFYYNSYTDQVYAIGNQNIYVSNDGGLNWLPFYFDDFGDGSKEIISTSNGLVLVSGKGQIWKFDQSGNLIRTIGVSAGEDTYVEMAVSKTGDCLLLKNMQPIIRMIMEIIFCPSFRIQFLIDTSAHLLQQRMAQFLACCIQVVYIVLITMGRPGVFLLKASISQHRLK